MKKEIKDYLHLYLGCKVIIDIATKPTSILISCHTNGNFQIAHAVGKQDYWNPEYIKPILRPLSDMTEDEAKACNIKGTWHEVQFNKNFNPGDDGLFLNQKQFIYLLSKRGDKDPFDLFGLIESGLAIDATKINQDATRL